MFDKKLVNFAKAKGVSLDEINKMLKDLAKGNQEQKKQQYKDIVDWEIEITKVKRLEKHLINKITQDYYFTLVRWIFLLYRVKYTLDDNAVIF